MNNEKFNIALSKQKGSWNVDDCITHQKWVTHAQIWHEKVWPMLFQKHNLKESNLLGTKNRDISTTYYFMPNLFMVIVKYLTHCTSIYKKFHAICVMNNNNNIEVWTFRSVPFLSKIGWSFQCNFGHFMCKDSYKFLLSQISCTHIVVFRVMALCGLVGKYQFFRETYGLHLQGEFD